jgi:hypothetical protein
MTSSGDSPRALREALLDAPAEEGGAAVLERPPPLRRTRAATWLRACALLLLVAALGFAVFMMVLADSLSRAFGGNGWHDWFPPQSRPT